MKSTVVRQDLNYPPTIYRGHGLGMYDHALLALYVRMFVSHFRT